jgi:plastocyanin
MTRAQVRFAWAYGLATAATLGALACSGGGGGGGNPNNPSPPPSSSTPTITITANGVDPKVVDIRTGQRVRFVNNDTRTHEMLTTPHLLHTDCPAINEVGSLTSGSNRMTGTMDVARICGYHDHMNPDDQRFRGQINVDTNEGPAPGYIRP